MLASDLLISELMTINSSTLADTDGEYSDWFEVYNSSASPIDLDGYFATDDAENLTQWQFPTLTLAAGERLVVFASGKDRTNPADELHTNFSLSGDGELLALVQPDGVTLEHAYAPSFPSQLSDISYGLSDAITFEDTLLDDGAALTSHIPTSNALGNSWTAPTFNDSAWHSGDSGLGYDTQIGAPQFALIDLGLGSGRNEPGSVQVGQNDMNGGDLPLTNLTSSVATGSEPFTISIDNGGLGGSIDWRDRGDANSGEALSLLAEDHVKNNAGYLEVTLGDLPQGNYTITSYHTDLSFTQSEAIKVRVNGVEQPDVLGRANFDLNLNTITTAQVEATAATFSVTSNGTEEITILFDASAANDTEVPLSGLSIISKGPLYEGLIETNVQADMFGQQTSAYVRVPFTVANADVINALTLEMQYDDGFIAYLNGQEVARRNAPSAAAYDSTSLVNRNDLSGLNYESIDISAFVDQLVEGDNLLAIHALNDRAGSPRFLIAPRLESQSEIETNRQYFTTPTPGSANLPGVLGQVEDTNFSVDRGFFEAPFQTAITTDTPGAEIRYTLNGTAPTATSGQVYSGPIDITTTTTLRAAAFLPGYLPSNADTQTYLFLADVLQQNGTGLPGGWGHAGPDYEVDPEVVNDPLYSDTILDDLKSLPSLSVVTDLDNWFGPSGQGIYLQGTGSPRGVSAEWINPDGSEGFQIDASAQIQGGSSTNRWKTDKLSIRLKFKEPYGPTKLDFPLFGEESTTEFDTIILDAVHNYSWQHQFSNFQRDNAKYIQDQIVADLQNAAGGTAPHGTYSHLYLNGLYWGMYYIHERPDESFASTYLGGDKQDYDVVKHTPGNVVNGTNDNYLALLDAANQDLSVPANYEALAGLLDVEDFIDYMIINFYLGNSDWAHHNWYASYNRVDPAGRWRFHSWDAEHVLTDVNIDVTGKNNGGGPTGIHQQLRANPEYNQLFADHVQQHFFGEGILTPDAVAGAYLARMDQVQRAIVGESARWGDNRVSTPFTQADWLATQQGLFDNYFPQRTDIVLNQFQSEGLYPTLDAPALSHNGGIVSPGFELGLTASDNIYYTLDGTDPRLPGGSIAAEAIAYNDGVTTRSLIAEGSSWNYLDNGSNQGTAWRAAGYDDSSWSSGPAQLGYGDSDEATSISFGGDPQNKHITTYFRHGFSVTDPSEYDSLILRLLRDDGAAVYLNGTEQVRTNLPTTSNYLTTALSAVGGAEESAWFEFTLDPTQLVSGQNLIAVELHQSSSTSSDVGFDLELMAGTLQSPTPAVIDGRSSVRARAYDGNDWSAMSGAEFFVNVPAAAGNLAITEINYNPYEPTAAEPAVADSDDFEFLELRNISDDVIDLDGVRFTDGIEFNFSSGSISSLAPGEHVVLVKNLTAFEARYGTVGSVAGEFSSGSLSNSGETLIVVDRFEAIIQSIEYNDSNSWPDRADGKGSSLEVIDPALDPNDSDSWRSSTEFHGTPGTEGIGPFADVIINEVLTHTDEPQFDSIELFNPTSSPLDVSHWWLSDDDGDYLKFQLPADTTIPAGGYLVFDENDFNATSGSSPADFALDAAHGDHVWLVAGDSTGRLTRFADDVDFVAAPNGESFGRWPNGTGELFPMTEVTLGATNSGPRFGPLVISEAMYHPTDPDGAGPLESQDVEFVEIYNSTTSTVALTDWELTGGVDYAFAPGTSLAGQTALVIISFDPTDPLNAERLSTFRDTYNIDNTVPLVGPYSGNLANDGERVRLRRPDEPPTEEPDFTPLLLEDEANYDDDTPWPTDPDGNGTSLTRLSHTVWGNDPAGWLSAVPTPGIAFPTQVVARHLFYNGSAFDPDPAANEADDQAIATDKYPLPPDSGQATSANFTSTASGITGLMIDVAQLPPTTTLTTADFTFRVGNQNNTTTWSPAATPTSISIRRGAGTDGSDRITLLWPAGTITNTWLQVRLHSNPNTGLVTDDLFYFGNAVGDATGDGETDGSDFMAVRSNPSNFLDPALIDNAFDLNRDRLVNATDLVLVRDHASSVSGGLNLITPTSESGQLLAQQAKSPAQKSAIAFPARKDSSPSRPLPSAPEWVAESEPLSDDNRAAILASLVQSPWEDALPTISFEQEPTEEPSLLDEER